MPCFCLHVLDDESIVIVACESECRPFILQILSLVENGSLPWQQSSSCVLVNKYRPTIPPSMITLVLVYQYTHCPVLLCKKNIPHIFKSCPRHYRQGHSLNQCPEYLRLHYIYFRWHSQVGKHISDECTFYFHLFCTCTGHNSITM